jgi:hypothetical protein
MAHSYVPFNTSSCIRVAMSGAVDLDIDALRCFCRTGGCLFGGGLGGFGGSLEAIVLDVGGNEAGTNAGAAASSGGS